MSLRILILLAIVLAPSSVRAQTQTAQAAIESVLTAQVEAWNRGDVATFVTTYAEDCTFVGKQMLQGRSSLLARYRNAYPSSADMGKLSFQNLKVRQLDHQIATAVGEWHIDRPAGAGGPVGGIFSLVLQLHGTSWQIVLDHTT